MRALWWIVALFTLTGSFQSGSSRTPRILTGEPQVHTMDGSGEPPKPPKP